MMKTLMIAASALVLVGCQAPSQETAAPSSTPIISSQPSHSPSPSPGVPTGHYLVVSSYGNYNGVTSNGVPGSSVTVFAIESNGSLTVADTECPFSGAPFILSSNTAKTTLYVSFCNTTQANDSTCINGGYQIFQYSVDTSTGALTNTTPGFSQSVFTAIENGANFSVVTTSASIFGTTYTIDSQGMIDKVQGGVVIDSYPVGTDPVSLLVL